MIEKLFEVIGTILKDYGLAGAILLYFLWKDSKTFEMYRNTMQEIVNEIGDRIYEENETLPE